MEAPGGVAFETSERSLLGLTLGFLGREVGLGGRVMAGRCDRDDVQDMVELAVAAAVYGRRRFRKSRMAAEVAASVRAGRLCWLGRCDRRGDPAAVDGGLPARVPPDRRITRSRNEVHMCSWTSFAMRRRS
jgi:hypothetical protein